MLNIVPVFLSDQRGSCEVSDLRQIPSFFRLQAGIHAVNCCGVPGLLTINSDKCMMSYVNHCGVIRNSLTALKIPVLHLLIPLSFMLNSHKPLMLVFPECCRAGIYTICILSRWASSHSNIHLRHLPVFLWLDSSLLFFLYH